jgi:DNA polymerase-3 subunit delta
MANYLVSVVGDDFNTLINELSKVCHFCGEGEITKSHIDEVAVKTDDAKIYLLTKALISGDFDKALEVLHILLRQKTEPEYILGTLVSTYVDMYRAKISVSCGERAEALSEPFKYGKLEFRLTNGARDASKMNVNTLRLCLEELSEADMKLKSGRDLPTVVLEQLMVKLFIIRSGERV